MEPPAKRLRLSSAVVYDQLPDIDRVHSECRKRLKSSFESIFERYGRDFGGISDEIDLKTGEVAVDQGHIREMRAPDDLGLDKRRTRSNEESKSQELEEDSEDELLEGLTDSTKKQHPNQQKAVALCPPSTGSHIPIEEGQGAQGANNEDSDGSAMVIPAPWNPLTPAAMESFTEDIARRVAYLMSSGAMTTAQPQPAEKSSAWDIPPLPSDVPRFRQNSHNVSHTLPSQTPKIEDSLYAEAPDSRARPPSKSSSNPFEDSIWASHLRSPLTPQRTYSNRKVKSPRQMANQYYIPTPPDSAEQGGSVSRKPDEQHGKATNMPWSPEEDECIIRLRDEDKMTVKDIAEQLSQRTFASIQSRLHQLRQWNKAGTGSRHKPKILNKPRIPPKRPSRKILRPWSQDDLKVLVDLRDSKKLDWPDIKKSFPQRTVPCIKTRYYRENPKREAQPFLKIGHPLQNPQEGVSGGDFKRQGILRNVQPQGDPSSRFARLRRRSCRPYYKTSRRKRGPKTTGLAQNAKKNSESRRKDGEADETSDRDSSLPRLAPASAVSPSRQTINSNSQDGTSAIHSSPLQPEPRREANEASQDAPVNVELQRISQHDGPSQSKPRRRRGRPRKIHVLNLSRENDSSEMAVNEIHKQPIDVQQEDEKVEKPLQPPDYRKKERQGNCSSREALRAKVTNRRPIDSYDEEYEDELAM